eukprot:1054158-Pyramimonas_sp.AAC.1
MWRLSGPVPDGEAGDDVQGPLGRFKIEAAEPALVTRETDRAPRQPKTRKGPKGPDPGAIDDIEECEETDVDDGDFIRELES